MAVNTQTVETLNDLVRINNDRIAGYEKAADEIKDSGQDLRLLFLKLSDESFTYKQELEERIAALGGEMATGTTVSGKIYRAWMDIKNTISGKNRKAVLASCEYGEDKAQEAYNSALDAKDLDSGTRQLIVLQKNSLKDSHDMIKRFRDQEASVS